jgi:hypothetical protein
MAGITPPVPSGKVPAAFAAAVALSVQAAFVVHPPLSAGPDPWSADASPGGVDGPGVPLPCSVELQAHSINAPAK